MAAYSQDELMSILGRLVSGWENEVVEFKEANEANVRRGGRHGVRASAATDTKADFIRAHSQDDVFYQRLVEQYLKTFGVATRSDLNDLLVPKLGEDLSDGEKQHKIDNLLTAMRRDGVIVNTGSRRYSQWRLGGQSG